MKNKVFDTLLEPVFIVGIDHKVLYCNEAAATLCDLSERKILKSANFESVMKLPEWKLRFEDVTDATPYKEVSFESSSGKTGKIQVTVQPYEEQNGITNSWILFCRDVTLEERLQKKYRSELEMKEGVIVDLQKAQASLLEYSTNLEKLVAERTHEITDLNRLLTALLESLGQGFFVFNEQGNCLKIYSKACLQTVQTNPVGKKIWDVLKIQSDQVDGFQKWMKTIFTEMLPFSDLAPLGPATFDHSEGNHIQLAYYPLRSHENQIEGIVVVASDITNLVEAQKVAERERAFAKMIVNIIKNKRGALSFTREVQSLLTQIEGVKTFHYQNHYENVFRILHTLKGGAATFSLQEMTDLCHKAENELVSLREDTEASTMASTWTSIQVRLKLIRQSFEKFVLFLQTALGSKFFVEDRWIEIPVHEAQSLYFQLQNSSLALAKDFKEKYLLEPIEKSFETYKETLMDLAANLEKELHGLTFYNGHIKICSEAYQEVFSTFVHIFRNAIDHGLESPWERESRGKDPKGSLTMNFAVTADQQHIQITITDDGRGVDPAVIRQKCEQRGLKVADETDEQVIQHIFDPSFSTRDVVTDLSGRGVGLDAVKNAITKMKGSITVQTALGQGSQFQIILPWMTDFTPSSVAKAS